MFIYGISGNICAWFITSGIDGAEIGTMRGVENMVLHIFNYDIAPTDQILLHQGHHVALHVIAVYMCHLSF